VDAVVAAVDGGQHLGGKPGGFLAHGGHALADELVEVGLHVPGGLVGDAAAVRRWGIEHGYLDLPKGVGKAADHPVVGGNWWDVVKWCNAKSEKEGMVPCYYTGTAKTEVYRKGDETSRMKW